MTIGESPDFLRNNVEVSDCIEVDRFSRLLRTEELFPLFVELLHRLLLDILQEIFKLTEVTAKFLLQLVHELAIAVLLLHRLGVLLVKILPNKADVIEEEVDFDGSCILLDPLELRLFVDSTNIEALTGQRYRASLAIVHLIVVSSDTELCILALVVEAAQFML